MIQPNSQSLPRSLPNLLSIHPAISLFLLISLISTHGRLHCWLHTLSVAHVSPVDLSAWNGGCKGLSQAVNPPSSVLLHNHFILLRKE